jgi:hypothetical protein
MELGRFTDGTIVDSMPNFPSQDVEEPQGKWIYEVPNAFPFRGATFIDSGWAAARAADPLSIGIMQDSTGSLRESLQNVVEQKEMNTVYARLPKSLRYALAASSTDSEELVNLAGTCCNFLYDEAGNPGGIVFERDEQGRARPRIDDFELFETIANNPALPDAYKEVMVLRPGVQGTSEIVGEFREDTSHVFEYLRRNSYIPWGHYAANMANDAIRYSTKELSVSDIRGMRHLYYQRIYLTLAEHLGISVPVKRRSLEEHELEELRTSLLDHQEKLEQAPATLWGWNFGYDFSSSGYRLHASHQMIHMQHAVVPQKMDPVVGTEPLSAFSSGDMVAEVVQAYKAETGSDFFTDYLRAINSNRRIDQGSGESSLIVFEDDNVLLFVPKAQVSQWELQLMVTADHGGNPVGNIVEASSTVRSSIDQAMLTAQHILAGLGARMVTSIEYGKRIGVVNGQRLLYSFLPKLPWSMGAFSEAHLRFICGHFPEDFAVACRYRLGKSG